ncbi:hypothetical protein [Allorhizocola rhizosphaerae]|nr:hypothetical protein [Allorhizocola rhizosphaerae]
MATGDALLARRITRRLIGAAGRTAQHAASDRLAALTGRVVIAYQSGLV